MTECVSGIQINMWTLSQERRFITHRLRSRVKDDVPYGYEALDRESILHGNAGWLGDYTEISILPDKIARFLYEHHAESYSSFKFGLPILPDDRSRTDVHGVLLPDQVYCSIYIYTYVTFIIHCTYNTYRTVDFWTLFC